MNKRARSVPKRVEARPAAHAHGDRRPGDRRPGDRRVMRTQQALTLALIELVLGKRYAAITVQDLLDAADVGRSTFYAHYRNKDDLLLESFMHLLDGLDRCLDRDGPGSRRVAPVRELFQHVGEFTAFHRALARAHVLERTFQAGAEQMSRSIERRLAALPRPPRPPREPREPQLPLPVAAHAAAGALFSLLRWWIDRGSPHTPAQMDAMYHALVLPGAVG